MGCKNSTAAAAQTATSPVKPAVGTPAANAVVGVDAIIGTRVYTDVGNGVVGAVKTYMDTQIMVIQMDKAGTMSCPLDRLEELKKPPAQPAGPVHPAIGTTVFTKDGSGVVQEVKEYAGEKLMVIKMDIAGTMSCPLDRLESLKAPQLVPAEPSAATQPAEAADLEAVASPQDVEITIPDQAEETKVNGCFGGWCRGDDAIRGDDILVKPAVANAEAA